MSGPNNLPAELKLELLKQIDTIEVLKKVCAISKEYSMLCKQNQEFLYKNIKPCCSYVLLENYEVIGHKEFRSETGAMKHFFNELNSAKSRFDIDDDDNEIVTDIFPGLIKVTLYDSSDKIMSYMLCGICIDNTEKVKEELKNINFETERRGSDTSNISDISDFSETGSI